MIPADPTIQAALRAARLAAQNHMAIFENAGDTWHEEPMTELLLSAASPVVKFATFTHHEEAAVGGDWLWWWVDDAGESFGMLVQAKRLLRSTNKWDIDFEYKNGDQRRALVRTGLELHVAPMYAIYQGTSDWRAGAFCRELPHRASCQSCERSTVSLVPAIVTDFAVDHDVRVSLAMDAALPLEFISDPEITVNPVWDSNLEDLDPELFQFLRQPQAGARRVAQLVFERVTKIRAMQFSGPTETQLERGTEAIFPIQPDDWGHFARPYYPEILDGLRREAPDYVLDVLTDQEVPSHISDRVDGIAVFHC